MGAVVVRDGSILARAGNRTEELRDPTAHAELLALREAAQTLGEPRLPDCDLYVTLEPCPLCAAAISMFRVRRLSYAAYDPKGGGVDHGPRLFEQPGCLHKPELVGGLAEARSAKLLRDFFAARR